MASLSRRGLFSLENSGPYKTKIQFVHSVLAIPDPELTGHLLIAVTVLPFPKSEASSSEEGAETGTSSLKAICLSPPPLNLERLSCNWFVCL